MKLPDFKKKRDKNTGQYTITVDGKDVGKVVYSTKDTSIYAAISGRPGPRKWYPAGMDGKALVPGLTHDRMADAIRTLLEITAEPSVDLSRDKFNGLVHGSLYYKGYVFWVSRWPSETEWVVDGMIFPGAFCPAYSNGTGTRVTRPATIKDDECLALLNNRRNELIAPPNYLD